MARIVIIDEVGNALKALKKAGKTIAIAESCTGGLISHKITSIQGSSENFIMGLVAYTNEIKNTLLKVGLNLLNTFGAVSVEVAKEMARGICKLAGADIGISITGYADGDHAGEVIMGVHYEDDNRTDVKNFKFNGDRDDVKEQAAMAVIDEINRISEEENEDA